eukprot:jgi/Picre1/33474/NNA_008798.t1
MHNRFLEGFLKSWGVIIASEIGDKTFFIAAVMAMKNSRREVFVGAMLALAAMTVLSSLLGWAAPNLISKTYTHYAATILFFVFGFRILYDAYAANGDGESELVEVERELGQHSSKTSSGNTVEMGRGRAFTLTFLAEWGDRSQIATIGLAAASDVLGVTVGGILGHGLCTGAAVLGGKHLASHIDERMVGLFGGVLFLLFGAIPCGAGFQNETAFVFS